MYIERKIETHITLNSGNFNSSGNTKIISGLATSVSITKPMLPAKHEATVKIFGLKQEDIEQLTTLAPYNELNLVPRNRITVYAAESVCFRGDIVTATADYNSFPNIPLEFHAVTGYADACTPAPVYTYKGAYPIKEIFQKLANDMGKSLVDRGVSGNVRNLALSGDVWEKAYQLARQTNITLIVEGDELILIPSKASRTDTVPLWNKTSGMIGFPKINQKGITARHLYDPRIKLGGKLKVETIVPKASGVWNVTKISHKLECFIQGGKWETEIECIKVGV